MKVIKKAVLGVWLLHASLCAGGGVLKPFSTDGCSLFPDGTITQNKLWLNCCIEHDRAYWAGGTYAQREAADKALQTCVAGLGEPQIANMMLAGVQLGGTPKVPTPFRWGYGWSHMRGYAPLSKEEKRMVQATMHEEADARNAFTLAYLNDLEVLENTRNAMRKILTYMRANSTLFPPKKMRQKRVLTREQRMEIWRTWQAFLDRVMVLDALQERYAQWQKPADTRKSQARSLAYAAFLAQYRFSLEFITQMERDPTMHTVLNEAVPELGMQANRYKALTFRFLNVFKGVDFARRELKNTLHAGSLHKPLARGMEEDANSVWKQAPNGSKATAGNAVKIMKDTVFTLYFPLQKEVSEWMGDVKVLRPQRSLIDTKQIGDLHALLQPGDILLERREWFLSNIGLPGYWPHAALYVGTKEERDAFFDDDAGVERSSFSGDVDAYLKRRYPTAYAQSLQLQEAGHAPRVVEAISEGVSFTTLEHSVSADSVAILRPRLGKAEIAKAIARAFHYSGRPYDFNFDFLTDASLVCTELVYKAYEPKADYKGVRFPLEKIVGRMVTTANTMAQMFDEEYGKPGQQLDLIAFYDGHEWEERSVASDVTAFRESWKRPKWFIWVPR